MQMDKEIQYEAPAVEVLEVEVEKGFGNSADPDFGGGEQE